MDIDAPTPAESDLRAYVGAVAAGLGVTPGGVTSEVCEVSNAYLALERRLPDFPGRDVAVTWDEHRGWAVAIETNCGEDLIVLAFMGEDAVPEPPAVVGFVRATLDGNRPGRIEPPHFDDRPGLITTLATVAASLAGVGWRPVPDDSASR